jgi:hypothetical protein
MYYTIILHAGKPPRKVKREQSQFSRPKETLILSSVYDSVCVRRGEL